MWRCRPTGEVVNTGAVSIMMRRSVVKGLEAGCLCPRVGPPNAELPPCWRRNVCRGVLGPVGCEGVLGGPAAKGGAAGCGARAAVLQSEHAQPPPHPAHAAVHTPPHLPLPDDQDASQPPKRSLPSRTLQKRLYRNPTLAITQSFSRPAPHPPTRRRFSTTVACFTCVPKTRTCRYPIYTDTFSALVALRLLLLLALPVLCCPNPPHLPLPDDQAARRQPPQQPHQRLPPHVRAEGQALQQLQLQTVHLRQPHAANLQHVG